MNASEVVGDAAMAFLVATDGLPDRLDSDEVVLLASAAWLDFYDAVFPVVIAALGESEDAMRFYARKRDDLQRALREMASRSTPTEIDERPCRSADDECFGEVEDVNGIPLCEVHAQEHWRDS